MNIALAKNLLNGSGHGDLPKFSDPFVTAKGEKRASVDFRGFRTLWINTGTLCNLACENCYIESSPRNDRLAYISLGEVQRILDELDADWQAEEIGITGGEPFMNPDIIAIAGDVLKRGYRLLVLTNAMKPMMRHHEALLALKKSYGGQLTLRVSLDHYGEENHAAERGEKSWAGTLQGLTWLSGNGFTVHVAGRTCWEEEEAQLRAGYARLFADLQIAIDCQDPAQLVLFPEMDGGHDVPEITPACWNILSVDPANMMCATSRMLVQRKGAEKASLLACTLLAYDEQFELGQSLAEASASVPLNHPHCAKFCVLGGGACSV